MGGWIYPQFIQKDVNPINLDSGMLVYYHDNLHILWNKLEQGFQFDWSFGEILELHAGIIKEFEKRKIKHIFPINQLDNIKIEPTKIDYSEIEKKELNFEPSFTYLVEKKMNGFHATIHKKDNEVKIFSEQKKDLTKAFPTLVENIKKLSDSDFIIDGELVPYDKEGNTLGRNELMKYTGAVKSGKPADDSNIKLHVWDIIYFEKPINELTLKERIKILANLKFSDRVQEIDKKLVDNIEDLKKAINWASSLKGSEGAVVKNLDDPYYFGENRSWKKYRKLTSLIVSVLKKVPKKRNLYNYLVGIVADKKYLDPKYIQDNKLVLGHTFNTNQIFELGDKIEILVEEVWRHEKKTGIHYSIHKPRVESKTDKALSTVNRLEDIVTAIGVAITHAEIEGFEILISEQLEEKAEPRDEGKEIEVKNFPNRMQDNFRKNMDWNDYTMHVHTRGKTLHYDIRHKIDNLLEGITLFGRSTTDRLPIETQRNNIRSTIKMPQPLDWLKVDTVTHKGAIGATKKYPGVFTIISKGKYKILEVTDHVIRIEYKSDKGKINKQSINWAKKYNIPYANDLPNDLIDLTGKYSWHIAHIDERYIILFDKIKE